MSKAEAKQPASKPPGNPVADAVAKGLRAHIESIPEADRRAVFALMPDLIPAAVSEPSKEPRRAGNITSNVFHLYKKDPNKPKAVPEIMSDLEADGVRVQDPQAVYNAVQYLRRQKLILRLAHGLYVYEDGGAEFHPDIPRGDE